MLTKVHFGDDNNNNNNDNCDSLKQFLFLNDIFSTIWFKASGGLTLIREQFVSQNNH